MPTFFSSKITIERAEFSFFLTFSYLIWANSSQIFASKTGSPTSWINLVEIIWLLKVGYQTLFWLIFYRIFQFKKCLKVIENLTSLFNFNILLPSGSLEEVKEIAGTGFLKMSNFRQFYPIFPLFWPKIPKMSKFWSPNGQNKDQI